MREVAAAEPDDLAVWKHSRPARNPLGESPVRTCGGSVRDLQGEREREGASSEQERESEGAGVRERRSACTCQPVE